MRMSCHLSAGLFGLALLVAVPVAGAQSAGEKYNQILQQTEEDYYNCAKGLRGKARSQAYIEHGKRAAALWEGWIREYGTDRMVFNARLNLAQALDMAKEPERARAAVDEAAASAVSHLEIRRAAEVTKMWAPTA